MRRVLVPLDGTEFASSILPDAKLLAGDRGTLILIGNSIGMASDRAVSDHSEENTVRDALAALETEAEQLRSEGVSVETHAFAMDDRAEAIHVASRMFRADIVACATHGRGPVGRAVHGGVVWQALAHSPVPVLIRNRTAPVGYQLSPEATPRILVPLDGSRLAELAVPLAQELMHEWNAAIWLVHVVSSYPVTGYPRSDIAPDAATDERAERAAQAYLDQIGANLSGTSHRHVVFGQVAEQLAHAVRTWDITHVVMTSHGRTGLARLALGSVADNLIHRLPCPIIVVPVDDSTASDGDPIAVSAEGA